VCVHVVAFTTSDSGSGGNISESGHCPEAPSQRGLACLTFAPGPKSVGLCAASVTEAAGPERSQQFEVSDVRLTPAAPTPSAGARRKLFQVHGGLFRRRKRKEEKPKGPPTPPFLTYTGEPHGMFTAKLE
jgi:hypothetical protein